jgi:hypothetical protein
VGVCSPDILFDGHEYILGFNTWGQPKATPNQLFIRTSPDLAHWSEPRPLAPNLTHGHRCIDLALARHGGLYAATWKEESSPRFAVAETLEGPWRFAHHAGWGKLVRSDGSVPREEGLTHENGQFLLIDGTWHLLTTDYSPHEPWLYRMDGDPDCPASWASWVDGIRLDVPPQAFNSFSRQDAEKNRGTVNRSIHPCRNHPDRFHLVDGLCNAPFLWDERSENGFFYMLYAGKNLEGCNDFNGRAGDPKGVGWPRGWNRLALARSRDLLAWEAAAER